MSDETAIEHFGDSDERLTGEKKGRTSPVYTLEQAVAFAMDLKAKIGITPASSGTIATALGHQSERSGTAGSKIGSMTHYGLLEWKGKGQYVLSDLAIRVLMPQSEIERRSAIAEAAKKPKLYGELAAAYKGQALPTMLSNILARQYGVAVARVENVADVFRKSMEYSGLLRRGILYDEIAIGDIGGMPTPASNPNETPSYTPATGQSFGTSNSPSAIVTSPNGHCDYQVVLPGRRCAYISLPEDLSRADIMKLKKWIDDNAEELITEKAADGQVGG